MTNGYNHSERSISPSATIRARDRDHDVLPHRPAQFIIGPDTSTVTSPLSENDEGYEEAALAAREAERRQLIQLGNIDARLTLLSESSSGSDLFANGDLSVSHAEERPRIAPTRRASRLPQYVPAISELTRQLQEAAELDRALRAARDAALESTAALPDDADSADDERESEDETESPDVDGA